MARKSNLSIRAAVMNCLARTAESKAPLCCLGEFLEKLSAMGWDAEDVFAVERSVLHLLGKMNQQSIKDHGPPQPPPAPPAPPASDNLSSRTSG